MPQNLFLSQRRGLMTAVRRFGALLLLFWISASAWGGEPASTLADTLKKQAHGKLALLNFYSDYCHTCLVMREPLRALKQKTRPHIRFIDLNLDKSQHETLAKQYRVTGTPTYLVFNPQGQLVYRMADVIAPAMLAHQLLRISGQLPPVNLLPTVLPAKALGRDFQNLILLSVESAQCKECQDMKPYLSGFEQADDAHLRVVHLQTDTPQGQQQAKALRIRKLPTYLILDNSQLSPGDTRGELLRIQGDIPPQSLWDAIRLLGDDGLGDATVSTPEKP